jgi:hypothetical protein
LRFYDPIAFQMLFGPKEHHEPIPDPGPAPKLVPRQKPTSQMSEHEPAHLQDIIAWVNRLEAILMMRGAKGETSK